MALAADRKNPASSFGGSNSLTSNCSGSFPWVAS